MSKSSSRPQASVFGALGADDAYFSSRVQVAARDAEQRWPLLGGLSPEAAEAPPPLGSAERSQWAPRQSAEETPARAAPHARKGLDSRLESGLSRLLRQSDAEAAAAGEDGITGEQAAYDVPTPEPLSEPVRVAATPRRSTTPQGRAPSAPARPSTAGRQAPERAPAAVTPPATPVQGRLTDIFNRLARPAAAPAPSSSGTARPSLLGRLGKR